MKHNKNIKIFFGSLFVFLAILIINHTLILRADTCPDGYTWTEGGYYDRVCEIVDLGGWVWESDWQDDGDYVWESDWVDYGGLVWESDWVDYGGLVWVDEMMTVNVCDQMKIPGTVDNGADCEYEKQTCTPGHWCYGCNTNAVPACPCPRHLWVWKDDGCSNLVKCCTEWFDGSGGLCVPGFEASCIADCYNPETDSCYEWYRCEVDPYNCLCSPDTWVPGVCTPKYPKLICDDIWVDDPDTCEDVEIPTGDGEYVWEYDWQDDGEYVWEYDWQDDGGLVWESDWVDYGGLVWEYDLQEQCHDEWIVAGSCVQDNVEKPKIPTLYLDSSSCDKIDLSWSDANTELVFYNIRKNAVYNLANTFEKNYSDMGPPFTDGSTHYYSVMACYRNDTSNCSESSNQVSATVSCPPADPAGSQCFVYQGNPPNYAKIYVNKNTTWEIRIPSEYTITSTNWKGKDLPPAGINQTNSSNKFEKIYNTIGFKDITATAIATYTDGTPKTFTCSTSTNIVSGSDDFEER